MPVLLDPYKLVVVGGGGNVWSFVGSSGAEINSGAGGTLTLPTHNEDDLIIIGQGSDGALQGGATSGYTDVGLTTPVFAGIRVDYKIAGASESDPSIASSGGRKTAALAMVFRYSGSLTSISTGFTEGTTGVSNTSTFSGLSVNDDDLALMFAVQDDSATSASSYDAILNDVTEQSADTVSAENRSAQVIMGWDEIESNGTLTLGNLTWGKSEENYASTIRFRPS